MTRGTLASFAKRHWSLLAAGAVGAAWFLSCAGALLNPFDVDVLLHEDWSTHELGWLFFRNEPWRYPFGTLGGLLYPVGTSVAYTDSIPLVALLFRLFSWALPADFQYIGLFLLACFVLNGVAGAWLVRAVSGGMLEQFLGGVLFVSMPALLGRLGHPSLCAQGLLLVPMALTVSAPRDLAQAQRMALGAVGVAVLAAGLHPYLAVMVGALALPVPLKLWLVDRKLLGRDALGLVALGAMAMWGELNAFGYFQAGVERDTLGFGAFSADLGTFINPVMSPPLSFSRWLRAFPVGSKQYEGFAYLGLGVLTALGLAGVSLVVRVRHAWRLPFRRLVFLVPTAVGMGVFALASPWTLFGVPVKSIGEFYAHFPDIVGAFRSTGRFIWPLMYGLTAFGVLGLVVAWRAVRPAAIGLLAACVALQLADVTQAPVRAKFSRGPARPAPSNPVWNLADGHYRHLAMVPAEVWMACVSRAGFRHEVVISLATLAYRHHLTFNSGYVARISKQQAEACKRETSAVAVGELDPQTIYVVWPDMAARLVAQGAHCGALDGFTVCVRPLQDDGFARALGGEGTSRHAAGEIPL